VQLILTALESPTNAGGTGEGRQRDTTKAKAVSKTTVFTHLDATCGFAMAMPGDVPSSLGLRKIANYWALLAIATSGWVLSSHTNSCQLGSSSDAEVLKVHIESRHPSLELLLAALLVDLSSPGFQLWDGPSPPIAELRDVGAGLGCDALEDGVISLAALPEAIFSKERVDHNHRRND
jgi:hypothetical protein